MSDSEELLFGDITDVGNDADSDENQAHDGTVYPQRLHTVAMDSCSDSGSSDHLYSSNKPIEIKKSKSKTKLQRDKSRKRIKQIAMNDFSEHNTNASTNSKPKKYKIISGEDSEDEFEADENDAYEDEDRNYNMRRYIHSHLLSIILTFIVFISLLVCIITGHIASIILFIFFYFLYLVECYMNKTWKEMSRNGKESGEGSINLLDTLRNTPPVIDWYIECYHYESTHSGSILIHAATDNENERYLQLQLQLEELGFNVKYFKWDWNGDNAALVAEKDGESEIAAVIVPSGFEGKRIEKAMLDRFDFIFPPFFEWNEDIDELLDEFKKRKVIQPEKEKIVTYTNSMIYDYNEWNDTSGEYPDFNKGQITKLNITKTYRLSNEETENDFNEQKQSFLTLNDKDEFQSMTEKIMIRGFKDCVTIQNSTERLPFWYHHIGYWICSVLLFTLYPRYKYETVFVVKNWEILKSISI